DVCSSDLGTRMYITDITTSPITERTLKMISWALTKRDSSISRLQSRESGVAGSPAAGTAGRAPVAVPVRAAVREPGQAPVGPERAAVPARVRPAAGRYRIRGDSWSVRRSPDRRRRPG